MWPNKFTSRFHYKHPRTLTLLGNYIGMNKNYSSVLRKIKAKLGNCKGKKVLYIYKCERLTSISWNCSKNQCFLSTNFEVKRMQLKKQVDILFIEPLMS